MTLKEQYDEAVKNNPNKNVTLEMNSNGEVVIIVSAISSMSGSGDLGHKGMLNRAMEKAMQEVVEGIMAEGIPLNDTATILARKAAARQFILQKYNEYLASFNVPKVDEENKA